MGKERNYRADTNKSPIKKKADKQPKKPRPAEAPAIQESKPPSSIPLELQQLLLNIFQSSSRDGSGEDLSRTLQEVKGHLYNRDFATAFGKEEYLDAYAMRWSPSRALGYTEILYELWKDHLADNPSRTDQTSQHKKVVCLGGGAGAEIVALGGLLNLLRKQSNENATEKQVENSLAGLSIEQEGTAGNSQPQEKIEAIFLDIADWSQVISNLHNSLINPPPISAYASAAAKASNKPLIKEDELKSSFKKADALAMTEQEVTETLSDGDLITLFFTLNELYSTSLPKTQALLGRLTKASKTGALLLVVDSAGSYSTVSLNGKEKKYPMHWLLDHALLGPKKAAEDSEKSSEGENAAQWEKLQEEESRWFRIANGLKYSLELENMRYQLHLYRKL